MKQLNVILNLNVDDDATLYDVSDLIDYMIDQAWDSMYEYNEKIISYSITDGHDIYSRNFDWSDEEED